MSVKNLRTCEKEHKYYKGNECLTCPACELERKPTQGFLSLLSAPARRAIKNKGIKSAEELAGFTEKEILSLHGMGKSSLPQLHRTLQEKELKFKK